MKKYQVTIQAIITKTITVEAESEEDAEEIAHELFNPNDDRTAERYEQNTTDTIEVMP